MALIFVHVYALGKRNPKENNRIESEYTSLFLQLILDALLPPTHRLFHTRRLYQHLTSGISAGDFRFCSTGPVASILTSGERCTRVPSKWI
jgi:hypothetical protein